MGKTGNKNVNTSKKKQQQKTSDSFLARSFRPTGGKRPRLDSEDFVGNGKLQGGGKHRIEPLKRLGAVISTATTAAAWDISWFWTILDSTEAAKTKINPFRAKTGNSLKKHTRTHRQPKYEIRGCTSSPEKEAFWLSPVPSVRVAPICFHTTTMASAGGGRPWRGAALISTQFNPL